MSLMRKGMYRFFVMEENGRLKAYAGYAYNPDYPVALCDYIAVLPEYRGTGIGGKLFSDAKGFLPVDGIISECELPDASLEPEERARRKKRIRVFLKAGAQALPYGWMVFGVDYMLLWQRINKTADEVDIEQAIKRIYKDMSVLGRVATRFFELDPEVTRYVTSD